MSFVSFRDRGDSDRYSEKSGSAIGSTVTTSDRWNVTDRASRLALFKEKKEEILRGVGSRKGRPKSENLVEDSLPSEVEVLRQCSLPVSLAAPKPPSPSGADLSNVSSKQLIDLAVKVEHMSAELAAQQKQLQELTKTAAAAASQKSLEECMARMEDQHRVHLEEMHHLQQAFANESECQGLQLQLDASKQRERSLEQQQIILQKGWDEEKADLEKQLTKLRMSEATLLQQLQQAIVEVPAPPVHKSEPPTFSRLQCRPPRRVLGLAVGLIGLVLAMTAHFKWHHTAAPHKPHRLIGPLGRVKRAA
eukprot:Skav211519  [mRNA]  locus=scaffold352:247468:248385:+ [translate_table: standard]